jgi:flagellar motor switch protein FliG
MSAATAVPGAVDSGIRKAAILLIQLGPDKAGSVLSHMNEAEVEAVTAEIARLESLDSAETGTVLVEFRDLAMARAHIAQGGPAYALQLLEQSLGADRANEIMHRVTAASAKMPFHFLQRADPRQLLSFISDEHPQVIALVLAHMHADRASLVLSGLSPERQADVAHRIAVMERTSPAIIRKVEQSLERKLSSVLQPSELSSVGGIEPLVDIINRSDRATERLIMEWLEGRDAALAEELKSRMFMFDDIVSIDDRSMQQVLRQVETADLALALKGVGEPVRDKVTTNMSERAAENLIEEVDLLGPVRLRQVEEAQQKIIQIIRTLEERGEIVVRRGNDDEFVD